MTDDKDKIQVGFRINKQLLINALMSSIQTLKNLRPYILVSILILSAVLTPPDIVSQIILAIPTYLLFETGLYFAPENIWITRLLNIPCKSIENIW